MGTVCVTVELWETCVILVHFQRGEGIPREEKEGENKYWRYKKSDLIHPDVLRILDGRGTRETAKGSRE